MNMMTPLPFVCATTLATSNTCIYAFLTPLTAQHDKVSTHIYPNNRISLFKCFKIGVNLQVPVQYLLIHSCIP